MQISFKYSKYIDATKLVFKSVSFLQWNHFDHHATQILCFSSQTGNGRICIVSFHFVPKESKKKEMNHEWFSEKPHCQLLWQHKFKEVLPVMTFSSHEINASHMLANHESQLTECCPSFQRMMRHQQMLFNKYLQPRILCVGLWI